MSGHAKERYITIALNHIHSYLLKDQPRDHALFYRHGIINQNGINLEIMQ